MQADLKKIITTHLLVMPTGSSLCEAQSLMTEKRIRHLPIVNDSGEIIGVLTQNSLYHLEIMKNLKVDDVMSTKILTINQNTPLRVAIFKFLENKTSSLLVIDQNRTVIGIMTTDDLLWHLSTLLEDAGHKRFSFSSLFDMQTVGEVAKHVATLAL